MARVAVIGAGLAGLVSAHTLYKRGHDVLLLEASESLGGQVQTESSGGYIVELGGDGFVADSQAVPAVAAEIGFADEIIGQLQTRSLGYQGGALRELGPGEAAAMLGFQASRDDSNLGVRTFARGMASFVDALASRLPKHIEIRRAREVATLDRSARYYRIVHPSGAATEAEHVVVATSSRAAARILKGLFGTPAEDLSQARTFSSLTVSLGFDRAAVAHPLHATGFIVAPSDQAAGVRACTFTSSKFAGRAPEAKVSLRVFFRPDDTEIKMLTDAAYCERATSFLAPVLGVTGAAERSWVTRWPSTLPLIDAAHRERVRVLEQALAGSGIALCGAAFHGASIDGAVRSAQTVADRI